MELYSLSRNQIKTRIIFFCFESICLWPASHLRMPISQSMPEGAPRLHKDSYICLRANLAVDIIIYITKSRNSYKKWNTHTYVVYVHYNMCIVWLVFVLTCTLFVPQCHCNLGACICIHINRYIHMYTRIPPSSACTVSWRNVKWANVGN